MTKTMYNVCVMKRELFYSMLLRAYYAVRSCSSVQVRIFIYYFLFSNAFKTLKTTAQKSKSKKKMQRAASASKKNRGR